MNPTEHWNAVLEGTTPERVCDSLAERLRARRLTFGDRLLCPFLRPFFLDGADEARVRHAAEVLWRIGERVVEAAMEDRSLLIDLALSDDEIRLASIDPGYRTTSTAARADAFLLPGSLQFAEYNAESPAGLGYSQGLAEVFSDTALMTRFRERFGARMYRPVNNILDALIASYREWGGAASPPLIAIVDWREVPTYSEFEIMRDMFVAAGVPTIICDPRELTYDGAALWCGNQAIDLVYRRVLINDIVARSRECESLIRAYSDRRVCVANSLRCKIPHKKAFFAVLTDERRAHLFRPDELQVIHSHVPWTALVVEGHRQRDGATIDLIPYVREHRETFVVKPNDEYGGTGVTLGWETTPREWDSALDRALRERDRGWVAQERIAVRREDFPVCTAEGIDMRDMLVDFAPYVFRGRMGGFLTRLSASGLANVTSGGGQVPAFVIEPLPM